MLLKKELGITLKSLTYWLVVLFIGAFLFTQLGSDFISLKQPEPGRNDYDITQTTDKKEIQRQTIYSLLQQYNSGGYNTYPFGFLKIVKLSKSDKATVKEILERATGEPIDELNKRLTELALKNPETDQFGLAEKLPITKGYSYSTFEKDMEKVAELIGNGSDFSKTAYRNQSRRKMTYQEARKEFQSTLNEDRVSGAFARMACDCLGLILALAPVFIAATVVLRDKRAQSQLVINSKQLSSFKLYGIRFLATVLLVLLPVMLFSLLPAIQSVYVAQKYHHTGDLILFYQYILGWTLPTIVAVVGISFLITTVFNGLVSVIFQLGFWLLSLLSGSRTIVGSVGLNLIPRFNSVGSRDVFDQIFSELVVNRVFWLALGLLCFLLSCVIFDRKRKGRMHYGSPR
ncbi:ABC transporter permease [Enterococcus sp. DIV0756]|uniref:ABC transporter permease n=1 Tax=Enterococcus sp. DIV0756 TaxID=2774636 RepID=UPI003F1FA92A